jgi:hypothetical protein
MSKEYNKMYEKLVSNANDFSGMIAYAIYKNEKRTAIKNGRDISEFVRLKLQPNEVRKFKTDADELINRMLQAAADEELNKVKDELGKKIAAITFNDLPKDSKSKSLIKWHNNGAAGIVGNFWTGAIVAISVWLLSDPAVWQQAKDSAYKTAAKLVAISDTQQEEANKHLNPDAPDVAPVK